MFLIYSLLYTTYNYLAECIQILYLIIVSFTAAISEHHFL